MMRAVLRRKIIETCEKKIASKGDNPALLMEVATWWIQTHQLDHFEKAHKIKMMIENNK